MATSAAPGMPVIEGVGPSRHAVHEKFAKGPGKAGMLIFGLVLIAGFIFRKYVVYARLP